MANLIWYSSPLIPLICVMYKCFNIAWAILVKISAFLPLYVCDEEKGSERKRKDEKGREKKVRKRKKKESKKKEEKKKEEERRGRKRED
jgi:hypothetical protein